MVEMLQGMTHSFSALGTMVGRSFMVSTSHYSHTVSLLLIANKFALRIGMKYQTVDLPNGMNLHVWGPISVRHNDLVSLHDSHINERLVQMQLGEERQWVIYGDSAYVHVPDSHILARHNNEFNTERQTLENQTLSACRECIEWDYGDGRWLTTRKF